jgi:hypothetical protein
MHRDFRRTLIVLSAALTFPVTLRAQVIGAAPAADSALSDARYLALGRQVTAWFFTGNTDSLVAHMSADVRTRLGGADGINRTIGAVQVHAGVEQEVVEEKMTRRRGKPQYWRESRYSEMSGETMIMRWVFDTRGQVVGFGLGPGSLTPAPD